MIKDTEPTKPSIWSSLYGNPQKKENTLPPLLEEWAQRVQTDSKKNRPIRLQGGGSKDFYGNLCEGEILDTRAWSGITAYDPAELVVVVRSGTRLQDLENCLSQHGQMLGFEPPHWGPDASVGGMVATGLAGPRRVAQGVYAGNVRDAVLGMSVMDGQGRILRFGGTVIKNVAGYDVSRLMVGSLGTLGILLEVALKVIPRPMASLTIRHPLEEQKALPWIRELMSQPMPISAFAWRGGYLSIRLEGAVSSVEETARRLGGEILSDQQSHLFWYGIREHTDPFFLNKNIPLWRILLPFGIDTFPLKGEQLIEGTGGIRWLHTVAEPNIVRAAANRLGGHAILFRASPQIKQQISVFPPLTPTIRDLQQRIKQVFDPSNIFNRGRIYSSI